MANRQTFPSSLFPLQGDVSAEAGSISVEVIGLQNIPIAPNPLVNGAVPTYVAANNDIEWLVANGSAVEINGVGVSPDKKIFINGVTDGSLVWSISVNGVPDGG